MNANPPLRSEPQEKIAIIGMAFRLPGPAFDRKSLWKMLCEKRSGISEIPPDRWNTEKFFDPDPEALAKAYTKWAGIVPGIDQFDPRFFGLAPREAASMDPQQRLMLCAVYEALEDAGSTLEEITQKRTGVFVGVSQSDYKTLQELCWTVEEHYAGTGFAMSIVANRISHRLNLTGPSFAVDTACSSSLVALDQAVRNLRNGTCDMAFAAGVNIVAHPAAFSAFSKAGMMSPSGVLSSFDKAADGYVRGEGVGVVMLKLLSDAQRDGDRIHAVIEATAVNQDGQTGTMTAPNPAAQIDVIAKLFEQSGHRPSDVGYAEAHGTGTPVGDPIEAGSIGQAIGRYITDRKLYLGSIKANIGHLESAAGLAGLIKAALVVKYGEIPPNTEFNEPNPAIPMDALNLEVPTEVTPFPETGGPRMAIINSFGFGGTNGSALVSSPPEPAAMPSAMAIERSSRSKDTGALEKPVLVPLSAATQGALTGMANALLAELEPSGSLVNASLKSLAAGLAARPGEYAFRAVILCRSLEDLRTGLTALTSEDADAELPEHVVVGQVKRQPKIVFTYSGQGNQSWNMTRDLMAAEPVFMDAINYFDTTFKKSTGWSILDEMLKDEADSRVHETWVTQPALFAVQTGISELWKSRGVEPDMVLGHSAGEVAASYDCGAITLDSAARYISKRGSIRDHVSAKGAMAAIGLPPEDVAAMLPMDGLIEVAARNGPGATTISGDREAVHAFVEEFEATYPDTFIRLLQIDGAWHSYQLEEAEEWLRNEVGEVDWAQPRIPFVSTVSAKPETKLDLEYCWRNLRQPVLYHQAVESAIAMGGNCFVEIGPHATLMPLTGSIAMESGAQVDTLSTLHHKEPDIDHFARAAAYLYTCGVSLNWTSLYGEPDRALELPHYQWDNERYWKETEESLSFLFEDVVHPLLGARSKGPAAVWMNEFDQRTPQFLKDHKFGGEVLFPAAGYVDVMLAAGRNLFPDQVIELEDVTLTFEEEPENTGRWLVLSDPGPETDAICASLSKIGTDLVVKGHEDLSGNLTDALADILSEGSAQDSETPIAGILFAWPASAPSMNDDCSAEEMFEAVRCQVQDLIDFGIALDDIRSAPHVPRVCILTKNARVTPDLPISATGLSQAPIVATTRSLMSELPEIRISQIDVDTETFAGDTDQIATILTHGTNETELALRGDKTYAARLRIRAREDLPPRILSIPKDDKQTNFTVTMPTPGVIDHIDAFECPTAEVGPNEVRIEIGAVGLNFRDIMAVTGLLPTEAESAPAWENLGLEFGGTIVAAGINAKGWKLGTKVMGMGRRCLQRYLTMPAEALIEIPDHLSAADASTIPSAFATAHYALNVVGRIGPGDKVLIHVATGGVGLAAIQFAKKAGAEIFATAGSDKKRAYLRELGIKHVMNSRSLDYADEIMQATDGQGVDVVLNSLPGRNIEKGLDVLAPYGRFLEIGKRDIYADSAIGLKAMRQNVSLHVIDLASMGENRPEMMGELMMHVMDEFINQRLEPLPISPFPVTKVRDAFRFMSQAQHVGKVVVDFDCPEFQIKEDRDKPVMFRRDGSYLITGGTQGFSLQLADWMSRAGAGKLILASRSGKVSEEDEPKIDAIKARGTSVRQLSLDVTNPDAVQNAVQNAAKLKKQPLAGVIHGAAVFKDTLLTMMTPELLDDVLAPKVKGGWALHQAVEALEKPLDFFVSFSSVAQIIGSLGQTNYTAANMFLDALADYRAASGGQGGTMDWGAIADAGFVARNDALASYLETAGVIGLSAQETEGALAALLRTEQTRLGFAKADWVQLGRSNPALGRTPRYMSLLSSQGQEDSDLVKRLATLTGEALVLEIQDFVASSLADVLKVDASTLDFETPMSEVGLDSLSSFELKMRLESELNVSIAVSHFLKAPNIIELSEVLADEFDAERSRKAAAAAQMEAGGDDQGTVEQQQFIDRQMGLIQLSLGRFTSEHARLALEHSATCTINSAVDEPALQSALNELSERHPLLRLRCKITRDGTPDLSLGEVEFGIKSAAKDLKPLAVSDGELFAVALETKGDEKSKVSIRMHAALGDATSADILVSEISALLNDEALSPLDTEADAVLNSLSYEFESDQGMSDRSFWEHVLFPVPKPVDFAKRTRALVPEYLGRDHGKPELIKGTLTLPEKIDESVTIATFADAIRDASGAQNSVVIARDVDLRGRIVTGKIVGPFMSTLPTVVPDLSTFEWVKADFQRIFAAAPNHAAFDVFTAANEFEMRLNEMGVSLNQFGFAWCSKLANGKPTGCVNDLRLEVAVRGKKLRYRLIYDSDVLDSKMAEALISTFSARVSSHSENPKSGRKQADHSLEDLSAAE